MARREKRCNECGEEFSKTKKVVDLSKRVVTELEVCPKCECEDWEFKLT